MKKQIVSILMCLCMLLSLLPVSVLAKTDDILSLDISQGNISIENGTPIPAKILLYGVNIEVKCVFKITAEAGVVNLILADYSSNRLKSYNYCAGLQKENSGTGSVLTISGETSGTGSLTVFGSTFGAGIGDAYQKAGSDITIAGGTVYANAGDIAAGIGGGYEGSGNNITITGGTVYAYSGGGSSAGIGGGGNDNYSETGQDGDNITVP